MTADILAALNAERYGANQWWTRKAPKPAPLVDEVGGRRRLAECIAEADSVEHDERWRTA